MAGSSRRSGLGKLSGDLIRLSVGIEDIEDLKADLKEAFKTV